MTDRQPLSQWGFDALLTWLDPDHEQGAKRYKEIHAALVEIFNKRGFVNAEDLADKTIDRVVKKLPKLAEEYEGDPARYFYGVAKLIAQEEISRNPWHVELPGDYPATDDTRPDQDSEDRLECLEQCTQKLSLQERELILVYYQENEQAKIHMRKNLAARLGLSMNALRIRALRIRERLENCVEQCMEQKPGPK